MRTNLSEELKLNDEISLDDGSEKLPELEKEKEKLDKEIQKDLDAKVEVAEEIRDAEAPEAEANNAEGKSTKIKQFVEKLILEEPTTVLNEDAREDEWFERRSQCVSNVYNALAKYANFLYYGGAPVDDEEYNIYEELESVCEEACIKVEDGEWA